MMSYNLRFKEGDLLTVKDNLSLHPANRAGQGYGPLIIGSQRLNWRELIPGQVFLAISDSVPAPRENQRLYLKVMSPIGVRVTWASNFKMKKNND